MKPSETASLGLDVHRKSSTATARDASGRAVGHPFADSTPPPLKRWATRRPDYAFVSSYATVWAFVLLLGLPLFPNLVTSHPNPDHSLTIYNAASSPKTLTIMAIIAAIGMPFVLTYTGMVYWVFRGKVELGEHSY